IANCGVILNSPSATLNVTRGLIADNRTTRACGGIENNGGTVNLIDMSLGGGASADGNFANINGGGLHTSAAGTVNATRI
ncbi:MAG: hypothetical protein ACR2NX_02250, partial [Chthoniobacterales bacterium]